MIRVKKDEMIFMFLSVVNILVTLLAEIKGLSYVIFLTILIFKLTKRINSQKFLLYSLFIPNKYLQLTAIPIYLMFNRRLIKSHLSFKAWLLLFYMAAFGLLNCLIYNGLILSVLFQIGVYYSIFSLIQDFGDNLDFKSSFLFFNNMFCLQVVTSLLQLAVNNKAGDGIHGTLISAHYLGIYLLVYGYMLFKIKTNVLSNRNKWIRFVFLAVIFILADAKHVFIVALFAYLVNWIFTKINIKNRITVFGVCMMIGTVIFLNLIQTDIGIEIFSGKPIGVYFFNGRYNKKLMLFHNTMKEMKSWNGLVGFGVGQFGSQISITVSKGIIYEWNSMLSKYHYAIEPYADAMKGLMSEWYVRYGIQMSSMVLGYPLVSFVGMVAELGLAGYYMLLNLLDSCYKKNSIVFIIAFLVLTVFDTYLEIPCVFVLILIAAYLSRKKGKLVINQG